MKSMSPPHDTPAYSERQPEFWWIIAHRLKHAADLSWQAFAAGRALAAEAETNGLPPGDDTGRGIESELNASCLFLAALAIEYLAVGTLLCERSGRFLRELPSHRIIRLLEECGAALNAAQRRILHGVETTLQWHDRFTVSVHPTDLPGRAAAQYAPGALSADEKVELDAVFNGMEEIFNAALNRHRARQAD